MWLIGECRSFGGWAFSISRKILRIAPAAMAVVVLATLASQIFRMLAFLLPLKIVILIGSDGVPRYFPPFLLGYDRDNLVVGLGIATVCFFLSHLIAERVVDRFTERTADRVLAKSDKLALFQNQDNLAHTTCRQFAETIAAAIFFGLVLVLIGFVHTSVAVLLTAWALGWFAFAAIGGAVNPRFRSWLEGNASNYANTAGSTGVFAVTGLIILEFVSGADLHILFAIVSIILSRQALSRGSKAISNALTLSSRKLLINALFFRGHVWQGETPSRRRNIWNQLATDAQQGWLPGLLEEASGKTVQAASITQWHQTGLPDVLAVEAFARHNDGDERTYFVKMFGYKDLDASHEAALHTACGPERLPAPSLLGRFKDGDFTYLVYRNLGAKSLGGNQGRQLRMAAFAECWSVELPRDLVNRFRRTHRLLHQRLGDAGLDRLALATFEPEQQRQVETFRRSLGPLCKWLGNVPQALFNPRLNEDTLFAGPNDSPVVTDWGRWGIEPVGAGWPTSDSGLNELTDWLYAAQAKRPALAEVTAPDAQFVALLFDFENAVRKQNMRRAMAVLPAILSKVAERGIAAAEPDEVLAQSEHPAKPVRRNKAKRLARTAK